MLVEGARAEAEIARPACELIDGFAPVDVVYSTTPALFAIAEEALQGRHCQLLTRPMDGGYAMSNPRDKRQVQTFVGVYLRNGSCPLRPVAEIPDLQIRVLLPAEVGE